MKSLKLFCAIGLLSFFTSCTNQEEAVTFYLDNQLKENLIIERISNESNHDDDIFTQVPLDLRSSESYDKYIRRLRELDIERFDFSFNDYEGQIQNGQLYLEDILLGDFEGTLNEISINDPELIRTIEELFLERTQLNFSFVGESVTNHYLSVEVNIEMKGTFVH